MFELKCGTREQVWHGIAYECVDGALKKDLRQNEADDIVVSRDYRMPDWFEAPTYSGGSGPLRLKESQDTTQKLHKQQRDAMFQLCPHERDGIVAREPWLKFSSGCGTYDDVWDGRAYMAEKGGLAKNQLTKNSDGKIVSLKRSEAAKRRRMAAE